MTRDKIDGILFREMFQSGAALLSQNRESVNALNVFPVPDGDTGTNMTQTINSAVKEMEKTRTTGVGEAANAIARGALKGARGNSGVILSQILRGFARVLDGCEDIDAQTLVKALRGGADTAYKAVMKPKEGTILTLSLIHILRLGTPLTITRTFCVLGAQVRRVLRFEWLTLFPYFTPFWQISQYLPILYYTSFKAG